MNLVEALLNQLGPAVLLPIPAGQKGPRITGWQKLSRNDMNAEYLRTLNHGNNVGVLLGEPSNGLCSIDADNDDFLEHFLNSNPDLRESLISRGARGGNIWLRVKGKYPKSVKLTQKDGSAWGEWRADGNQTVIYGTHPSGCDYAHNGKRALTVAFDTIIWPSGISLPWKKVEAPKTTLSSTDIPENTDLGRALRFIERFGPDIRHVYEWNKWLVFENTRWNADGNAAAHRLAGEICQELVAAALSLSDNASRQAAFNNARAWADVRVVNDMLASARNDVRVIVRPTELDANPWLAGSRNGVVDLRTGVITEHSRDQLVTRCLGADFDAHATCPRWIKFIEEIFPDETVRRFVWKTAGYSLSGHTTEHFFMFLHGRGANGKSTLLEVLSAAFGEYATRAGSRLIYATDHHGAPDDQIAELFGRRLVIASETSEGARLQEGILKDISAGDTLRGCRKYEGGFSFTSTAKLWMAGNHKPAIRGTDDGIWRRVTLIPFDRQFGPDERDESLRGKLLEELPGILNWLVQGCLLWQSEGLKAPQAVRTAVDEYRSEEDALAGFIEECTRQDMGRETPHSEIYSEYQHWAAGNGIKFALSSKLLAKKLRERGWIDRKTYKVKCLWRGVTLTEMTENDVFPQSSP